MATAARRWRLIADRVGMSAPGLLHHFPSKEHLLIDLLALRHERDAERVQGAHQRARRAPSRRPAGPGREATPRAPGWSGCSRSLPPRASTTTTRATTGSSSATGSRGASLAERLIEEQRLGLIRDDVDPELIAAQILAMFDGLQLQWLLDPDEVDMVTALGDYLGDLRSRLAPPGVTAAATSGASARSRTRAA